MIGIFQVNTVRTSVTQAEYYIRFCVANRFPSEKGGGHKTFLCHKDVLKKILLKSPKPGSNVLNSFQQGILWDVARLGSNHYPRGAPVLSLGPSWASRYWRSVLAVVFFRVQSGKHNHDEWYRLRKLRQRWEAGHKVGESEGMKARWNLQGQTGTHEDEWLCRSHQCLQLWGFGRYIAVNPLGHILLHKPGPRPEEHEGKHIVGAGGEGPAALSSQRWPAGQWQYAQANKVPRAPLPQSDPKPAFSRHLANHAHITLRPTLIQTIPGGRLWGLYFQLYGVGLLKASTAAQPVPLCLESPLWCVWL